MTPIEKHRLKENVLEGELSEVFAYLIAYLPNNGALLLNDLLVLESRYRRLKKDQLTGVLDYATEQVSINKINLELLYFIDQIPEVTQAGQPSKSQRRKGKVLHDIPDSLPLQKLTKCVVRIGETDAMVLEDFKASENTVIEEINIGQDMAVELFELGKGGNFEIQSANSSAQSVDSFEATEWKFYVRPLVEGMHLLFLRISIVRMVDGKELTKETVLEQEVSVTSEIPEIIPPRNWNATNVVITENEPSVLTAPAPSSFSKIAAPKKIKRALFTQFLLFGGLGLAFAATTVYFHEPILRVLGIKTEVVNPTPQVGPQDTLSTANLAPLDSLLSGSTSSVETTEQENIGLESAQTHVLEEQKPSGANALPKQAPIVQPAPTLPKRKEGNLNTSIVENPDESTVSNQSNTADSGSINSTKASAEEAKTEEIERYRLNSRVLRQQAVPLGKKVTIGVNIEGFDAKALRFSLNSSTILKPARQTGNYLFFEFRSSENNQQLRIDDAVSRTSHVQVISGSNNSLVTLRKLDL